MRIATESAGALPVLGRGTARQQQLADALNRLGDVLRAIIDSGGFDAGAFLDPRVRVAAERLASQAAALRDRTLRQECETLLVRYHLLATLAPPGPAAQSWARSRVNTPGRSELLQGQVKEASRCLEAIEAIVQRLGDTTA
jgi:hypothetical protein